MNYKFSKNKNFYPDKYDELYIEPEWVLYEDENYDVYSYLNGNDCLPISKLNKSNVFYELVELLYHIKFHKYKKISDVSHTNDFKQLIEYKFLHYTYNQYSDIQSFQSPNTDLFFFNTDANRDYLFFIIYVICNNQSNNGSSIIRMNYKNTEFIYLITTLFEKTFICRPTVMSSNNEDFYVICQNYNNTYKYDLGKYIIQNMKTNIYIGVPCHFINVINEIFVLIKQKYLLYKKNITFLKCVDLTKLDRIRNKNIYDCIKWCQTYDIPYNMNKVNIFNDKI